MTYLKPKQMYKPLNHRKQRSYVVVIWMYVCAVLISLILVLLASSVASKQQSTSKGVEAPHKAESSQEQPFKKVMEARVTQYKATGYRMANGQYPYDGAVAVSDRTIPLNTEIAIYQKTLGDGTKVYRVYDVADRTALWVHNQKGFTVDVFTKNSEQEALQFGAKKIEVQL